MKGWGLGPGRGRGLGTYLTPVEAPLCPGRRERFRLQRSPPRLWDAHSGPLTPAPPTPARPVPRGGPTPRSPGSGTALSEIRKQCILLKLRDSRRTHAGGRTMVRRRPKEHSGASAAEQTAWTLGAGGSGEHSLEPEADRQAQASPPGSAGLTAPAGPRSEGDPTRKTGPPPPNFGTHRKEAPVPRPAAPGRRTTRSADQPARRRSRTSSGRPRSARLRACSPPASGGGARPVGGGGASAGSIRRVATPTPACHSSHSRGLGARPGGTGGSRCRRRAHSRGERAAHTLGGGQC